MRTCVCVWLVVGLSLGLLHACGDGATQVCGGEHDLVPDIISDESDLDTFWVGNLGIDELHVIGTGVCSQDPDCPADLVCLSGKCGAHDTLVQANFSDFTDYQVVLAPTLWPPPSPACVIYTGLPEITGASVPLTVTSATFRGLAGGEVVLTPTENNRLPPVDLPGRGFQDVQVAIEVLSGSGASDFPAFSASLPAPAAPVLTRLGDREDPDLAQAPSVGIKVDQAFDLELGWEAGEGDYIEVKIIPGSGSTTPYGKLRCITFDDGCLSIPATALNNLALDTATNFKLRIERHNFLLKPDKQGDVTRSAALIDLSSSLEGVVLR